MSTDDSSPPPNARAPWLERSGASRAARFVRRRVSMWWLRSMAAHMPWLLVPVPPPDPQLARHLLRQFHRRALRPGRLGPDVPITKENLDNWFLHHPPVGNQQETYLRIREAGKVFAQVILESTPASADQSDAIRKVREAVMTANAAIACGGH